MNKDTDFENYLFFSNKEIILSIFQKNGDENLYQKKKNIAQDINTNELDILNIFLCENILKAEKNINNFIKDVILVIDLEKFSSIRLSIKKDLQKGFVDSDNIIHLLNEAKTLSKETLIGKKIIHMTIEKYILDGKNYYKIPKNEKGDSFAIEIKFICLPIDFVKNLEKIFKDFQISIKNILSANYIQTSFSKNERFDFFLMTKKLLNGHNENEILLVDKTKKNKGFFEKFFAFFN